MTLTQQLEFVRENHDALRDRVTRLQSQMDKLLFEDHSKPLQIRLKRVELGTWQAKVSGHVVVAFTRRRAIKKILRYLEREQQPKYKICEERV